MSYYDNLKLRWADDLLLIKEQLLDTIRELDEFKIKIEQRLIITGAKANELWSDIERRLGNGKEKSSKEGSKKSSKRCSS